MYEMCHSFVPLCVLSLGVFQLDKDAAAVREQLEKDLEAAKAQLVVKRSAETTEPGDQELSNDVGGGQMSNTEIEVQFKWLCVNFLSVVQREFFEDKI